MTHHTATSAADTGLPKSISVTQPAPDRSLQAMGERLAQFAQLTGTKPPSVIVQDKTFSAEILAFANETGLSLDWLCSGDVRSMIMGAHNEVTSRPTTLLAESVPGVEDV